MRVFLLFSGVLLLCILLPGHLAAEHEWRSVTPTELSLWQDGVQIGNLRLSDGTYFSRTSPGVWEGPCECPVDLPPEALAVKASRLAAQCSCCFDCPCGDDCLCGLGKPCCGGCRCLLSMPYEVQEAMTLDEDGTPNFGIGRPDKIESGKHLLNGKEVSKQELLEAIEKVDVPQDADAMCVTVIGPDEARKPVVEALTSHPALAQYKGKIRLQDYAPNHWAVTQSGFVTTGKPTIYCQAPDGKVLHRQDDYQTPEQLAAVLEKAYSQLRDKRPDYDKDKDPNLAKPKVIPASFEDVPMWAWVLGGVALLILLSKNKENK